MAKTKTEDQTVKPIDAPLEPDGEITADRLAPLPRRGFKTDARGKGILSEVVVHAFGCAAGTAFAVCEFPGGAISQVNVSQVRFA